MTAELLRWKVSDTTLDPGEVLLRLVTQAAHRAELYAELLEQQYTRAAAGAEDSDLPAGVSALIGHRYDLDKDGNAVPVEEAIRGLVQLEGTERDRAAGFAAKAIAAGLAERAVRLAEKQHQIIAQLIQAVLSDPELGLTVEQQKAAPRVARRILSVAR